MFVMNVYETLFYVSYIVFMAIKAGSMFLRQVKTLEKKKMVLVKYQRLNTDLPRQRLQTKPFSVFNQNNSLSIT